MKNIRKDMRELRRDFNYGTLDTTEVPKEPIILLKRWLNDAVQLKVKDANAFVLSTVKNGFPDSRILLIRDITDEGLHFYTNYKSKKGDDIEGNSNASLNIFWPDLERQIRIHATLEKLPAELSDDYFKTRPRLSQIGAWASQQSQSLKSRAELDQNIVKYEKEFEGKEVTRPEHWGGYLAKPIYLEFWQGRPNRLHDRIIYKRIESSSWEIGRLYP